MLIKEFGLGRAILIVILQNRSSQTGRSCFRVNFMYVYMYVCMYVFIYSYTCMRYKCRCRCTCVYRYTSSNLHIYIPFSSKWSQLEWWGLWAILVRIQRLEVCCIVLPCVGGCCSVLRQQYRRECPSQCVAVHCSALLCVASECPLHYKWRSFRDFWMQICNDKARWLNFESH